MSSRYYNFLILLLMLASAILGGTIFDDAQVICEVILWILLGIGIGRIGFSKTDLLLLLVYCATSVISLLLNDFVTFALDFKIFGLCVFTFVYFRHIHFNPAIFINFLLALNAALLAFQLITGRSIIPTAYFGYYQTYAEDRPVGLFLTPHASSFFVSIYIVYIVYRSANYLGGAFWFACAAMTQSLTAMLALLAQLGAYMMQKVKLFRNTVGRSSLIFVVVAPIAALYFYGDSLLEESKANAYTRYYSLEILLKQIYNPDYYAGLLTAYPGRYQEYVALQEATFASVGNELGLIKIFVEGGIILGSVTLLLLLQELKFFRVFICISLLHYSFIINMPFMLFLMLTYNREIQDARAPRAATKVTHEPRAMKLPVFDG